MQNARHAVGRFFYDLLREGLLLARRLPELFAERFRTFEKRRREVANFLYICAFF